MMLLSLLPVLSLLLTLTPSAAAPAPIPASDRPDLQRRQATRSDVIARQQRGPARRQEASPVPPPVCAGSNPFGTEIYAVYTDGYPAYLDTLAGPLTAADQQACNVLCSANAGCQSTDFGAGLCFLDLVDPQSKEVIAAQGVSGSVRGVTCATAEYTLPEGVTCCNARA